jgi:hypothetical protein
MISVRVRLIAAVCLFVGFAVSCHLDNGTRKAHQLVGANGETLRAAFNADFGKVRVLSLVSPT